jgi:hypothetical protein
MARGAGDATMGTTPLLELPASLAVTGSRMLTGIPALGGVSERTAVVAPCSVLVMRGEARRLSPRGTR